MKTSLLALLSGVLVATASAGDLADFTGQPFKLTTNFGDTYYNCRVVKVTPETVTIMHEQGVTKIGLDLLSPDLQKKFNYDPLKAREYARVEQEKKDQEVARVRSLKEKRDREERTMMAGLMAEEKKQLQEQADREQARRDAARSPTQPTQPLAAMPGDPTPMLGSPAPATAVMQVESAVPTVAPITEVYSPESNRNRRYLSRDNGYYYPWYPGYGYGAGYGYGSDYGYTYPYYGSGYYYSRPQAPCPPFLQQARRPIISGTIKVGNGVIKINR